MYNFEMKKKHILISKLGSTQARAQPLLTIYSIYDHFTYRQTIVDIILIENWNK